jgi:hypothetical protein
MAVAAIVVMKARREGMAAKVVEDVQVVEVIEVVEVVEVVEVIKVLEGTAKMTEFRIQISEFR